MLAAVLVLWGIAALASEPASPASAPAPHPGPTRPDATRPEATRLEAAYSARAGLPLRQFGYDLLSHGTGTSPAALGTTGVAPIGGVQGDYVLGIGDDVQVVTRASQRSGRTAVGGWGRGS